MAILAGSRSFARWSASAGGVKDAAAGARMSAGYGLPDVAFIERPPPPIVSSPRRFRHAGAQSRARMAAGPDTVADRRDLVRREPASGRLSRSSTLPVRRRSRLRTAPPDED